MLRVRNAWAGGRPASCSEPERAAVVAAEDCLTKCAFEDAFMDSKFLKQGECCRTACSGCANKHNLWLSVS